MLDRSFYASTFVVADGVTVTWPFSFAGVNGDHNSGTKPYLYDVDVKVQELYTDENGERQTVMRAGVLDMPNQITITGPPVVQGREIRIYRETEIRFPLVDYKDLQSVSEHDLDLANRQAVFIAQETRDAASANILQDSLGNYDAKMRRIVNLADGVAPNDAVNMSQYRRTVRVPEREGIFELPPAAERVDRMLTFDAVGQPVLRFPSVESATDLERRLGLSSGAGRVGWQRDFNGLPSRDVRGGLNATQVHLWEFAHLVTNRPVATDHFTWDWTPALQAAAVQCRGRVLRLHSGIIRMDTATLQLKNITLQGDGSQNTVLLRTMPAATLDGMTIIGDGVSLIGLTLAVAGVSSAQVALRFPVSSSDHGFWDFVIDGTRSKESDTKNFVHGITLSANASVSNVYFDPRCVVHHCRYGLFTTNDFKGKARYWLFHGMTFHHNSADDMELNSEDNPEDTWTDCVLDGVIFRDWIGSTSDTGGGFAFGTDSGKRLIINRPQITGRYRQAIHIEDWTSDIQIINPLINGPTVGVYVYQEQAQSITVTGGEFIGPLGYRADQDPADMPEPSTVDFASVAVYNATPGVSSTSTCVRVHGITARGWEYGVVTPVDRGGVVEGNTLAGCIVAMHRGSGGMPPAHRQHMNRIYRCRYAYSVSVMGAIGHNTVEDCYALFKESTGRIMHLPDGVDIARTRIAIVPGYVNIPLFPTPKIMNGEGIEIAIHSGGISIMGRITATYDGTTLTSAKKFFSTIGTMDVSNTPLVIKEGMVCLTVNNVGSTLTASMAATVKNSLVYR